jgi:DNA-binding CsgD family transcriptional regulator
MSIFQKTKQILLNNMFSKFSFLLLIFVTFQVQGQIKGISVDEMLLILNDEKDFDSNELKQLEKILIENDSATVNQILVELQNLGPQNNLYFSGRLGFLKTRSLVNFDQPNIVKRAIPLMEEMNNLSYFSGNKSLIALSLWNYGSVLYALNQYDLASSYLLTSLEFLEEIIVPKKLVLHYLLVGEVLFHTRDFKKSIMYSRRGNLLKDAAQLNHGDHIRNLNTLGQSYLQIQELDSALFFFQSSFDKAKKAGNQVWMGINSSFMGQVYFFKNDFEKAKSNLFFDYHINKNAEFNIAANSMQCLSKIYLINENIDSAAICINESIMLLKKIDVNKSLQASTFLEQAFFIKADIFKKLNQIDSAFHYFQLYTNLHDSNEEMAVRGSNEIIEVRVKNEKNQFALMSIQRAIAKEEKQRNILISIIIFVTSFIFILMIGRQKRLKYKNEIFRIQKSASEAELNSAKDQLDIFTNKLFEKALLIESLESKLTKKNFDQEEQACLTELSNQKILTDEDWQKFKLLFEKLYPAFFKSLKEKSADITLAEQRIAALIRLQLSAKEMAAILGISVDSAHRTRSRLRLRLKLSSEVNLEEYLTNL